MIKTTIHSKPCQDWARSASDKMETMNVERAHNAETMNIYIRMNIYISMLIQQGMLKGIGSADLFDYSARSKIIEFLEDKYDKCKTPLASSATLALKLSYEQMLPK